jgi:hypothetical protein
MWRLLILFLFIFTNNPAYSLVQNVSIQCRADGPIYSGKIEYAAHASDWRITQVTQKECLLETQVPLRIEFNGMIYQKTSISETYFIQPAFYGKDCNNIYTQYGISEMLDESHSLKNSIGYQINTGFSKDRNGGKDLRLSGFHVVYGERCLIFE